MRTLIFLVALLACAGFARALPQQSTAPREIEADVSHVTGPHSRAALLVVGAGRANEGLRADWQAQLATTQKEIGFRYIRFHGLLDDDMGVYTEDANGSPSYNFQYVDTLYDALLGLHIRPFVELSFMPAKLASGSKTVFWYKANITPPKDMTKWEGLIRALITHWKQRYGEAEIAKWYFEVWNEPDLKLFFDGDFDQYMDLYRVTATAIKQVCPECRVGGPAAAQEATEKKFIDYVAAHHYPADFLSTHVYATKSGYFDATTLKVSTVFDTAQDALVKRICGTREMVDHSPLPKLEVHYTEWGSSYTSVDNLHDQYLQASFVLDRLRKALSCVNSMSYWTFTDIFEERGPRFTPFYGGFGMMNYEGIRKPTYFAYKYLAELGESDVAETDSASGGARSWITRTGDRQIQALFWDYSPLGPPAGQDDQSYYKQVLPAQTTGPVTLRLTHVPAGKYRLNVYRTGYESNDAYTAYLRMGAPPQITREQVEALQGKTMDAPVESRIVKVNDGTFNETFPMRQNDIYLVTLTRQ
ncbi:MAG: GH39 family glycosyl hydrolase [Terriglobales bacterium]